MGAAPHRDHADAEFARHRDRLLHRAGTDDEAEAVAAVERGGDRRHALGLERGPRIDQAAPHPVEIAGQPGEPMRVHAAQISADETGRDDGGIAFRHAMGDQDPPGKGIGRAGLGIDPVDDAVILGLAAFGSLLLFLLFRLFLLASRLRFRRITLCSCRHQSSSSCTCRARWVQAASRKAVSVPVET